MNPSTPTKKAAFSFETFQVVSFSFKQPVNENLSIVFNTKGEFHSKTNRFRIILEVIVLDGDLLPESTESAIEAINIKLHTDFKFADSVTLQEIPNYFYKNSIAIVFPYVRAFISTITLQANCKPVILPLMNLSALEEPLKENITVVED